MTTHQHPSGGLRHHLLIDSEPRGHQPSDAIVRYFLTAPFTPAASLFAFHRLCGANRGLLGVFKCLQSWVKRLFYFMDYWKFMSEQMFIVMTVFKCIKCEELQRMRAE